MYIFGTGPSYAPGMRTPIAMTAAVLVLSLAGCGSGKEAAAPATVTVTASPTHAAPPKFQPLYAGVLRYVDHHLSPANPLYRQISDNSAKVDNSMGQVCGRVDGSPVPAKFRADFASGVRTGLGKAGTKVTDAQALELFDTIVAGCYATGNATKYVKPVPTITEGTWTVGRDFPAGTYRSNGDIGYSCYWEISRSGSNGMDIVANDNVSGGHPTVTLSRGQDFKSQDCGTWKKVAG